MKKYFLGLTFLCISVLGLNAETFRESVGQNSFVLGVFYEDIEIDNKLSSSNVVSPSTWNQTYKAPVKRKVTMLKGVYGLNDYLDIYAGLGYTKETWNARNKNTGVNSTEQKGKDYSFELGIKGTAINFLDDKAYIAYLLKYNYLKTGEESYVGLPNPTSFKAVWKEYDAEMELGYRFTDYDVTLFSGMGYADIEVVQDLDTDHNVYENKDKLFYFIGLNKTLDNLNFSLEVLFKGKKSISAGISYKF